jgi:CHAT domain-containing protein/Tfp pilus assembly protein PilF
VCLLVLAALVLPVAAVEDGAPDKPPKESHKELIARAIKLHQQAVEFYQKGQFVEATRLGKQLLEVCQALYPKGEYPRGHSNLAVSLNNLGESLRAQGEYAKALPYHQQALAMRQALYPKDKFPNGHSDLAVSLHNLGLLLEDQGEYAKALPYYQQALAMNQALYPKAKYPKGHPELALSLLSLGTLLREQGEYAKALPYYQQALAMRQALYPKDKFPNGHSDLAQSLNNLGFLLRAQGEYAKALPYYQQALAMHQTLYPKAKYPDGHPDLAASLNNLGFLLQAQGENAKALPCYQQALAMNQAIYPKAKYPDGHPDLASSLNNLGFLLLAQGEYAKALPYYQQTLAMSQALFPKDKYPSGHPKLARSLNNLGFLLQAQGEYEKALPYYRQALEMIQALYPKDKCPNGHPHLASTLNNLGMLLQARGEYKKSLLYLKRAMHMDQDLVSAFASVFSEAEALNYFASAPMYWDALLSVSRHLSSSDFDPYPEHWRGKAILTRVLERRQQSLHQLGPNRKDWDELLSLRRQLSRLVLAPALPGKDHLAKVDDLTQRKEQLERKLAKEVPGFARQLELDRLSPADLAKNLPSHAVLVEMVHYVYFEYDPKKPGKEGKRRTQCYAAFVLRPGKAAQRVELGAAKPIADAVTQWRQDIAARKTGTAADTLRKLVWEPIAKHLPTDTETVFLVPDADLTHIPWAALPGKKKGSVLLEEYAIALVPHGLFLLDQLTAKPTKDKEPGLLLAVGDVSYDQKPKALAKDEAPVQRSAEVGDKVVSWPELPGTLKELDQVIKLAGKRPVVRRTGTEASTEQLLADLSAAKKAPRYVHLATHGFFADPKFRSVLQVDTELFKYRGFQDRARPGDRNPLVLSGIVLAGANLPPPKDLKALLQDDRGILTAETIAGLPLRQLELVVLSACETGLGEVAGREGVYGLQRAFHLAGAKNVIATLWKVDDEATAALMGLFYHKLWQEKQSPLQALREAQLYLYRYPEQVGALAKARGPKDLSKIVTLPPDPKKPPEAGKAPVKLWAGFVLSGAGQ